MTCTGCGTLCASTDCLRQHVCTEQQLVNSVKRRKTGDKPVTTHACSDCGLTFATRSELLVHSCVKVKQQYNYMCHKCKKTFHNHQDFYKNIHAHKLSPPYMCFVCGLKLTTKDDLFEHIDKHEFTAYRCEKCRRDYTKFSSLLSDHCRHVCKQCGAQFNQKMHLGTHERKHYVDEPYKCPKCTERFSHQHALTRHIHEHGEEKTFKCSACTEEYSRCGELIQHIVTIHTNGQKGVCPTCHKMFKCKSNLIEHIRKHTGARPYVCKTCAKTFSQASALGRHHRTHTDETYHTCPTCQKGFKQACDLTRHIRTHTNERPYVCKVCKKAFIQSCALQRHMKRHYESDLGVYACPICSAHCIKENFLCSHILGHHDKPYVCIHCAMMFYAPQKFVRHCKAHRNDVKNSNNADEVNSSEYVLDNFNRSDGDINDSNNSSLNDSSDQRHHDSESSVDRNRTDNIDIDIRIITDQMNVTHSDYSDADSITEVITEAISDND